MSILAIKLNKDNLDKVITIFENLGGYSEVKYNHNDLFGDSYNTCYMYEKYGNIFIKWGENNDDDEGYIFMTLEDFLEKYPYTLDDYIHVDKIGICRIDNMYWDGSQIVYEVIGDDNKEYDNITINQIKRKINFPENEDKMNTKNYFAIRGSQTRGNDIINLFNMFGVDNYYNMSCSLENSVYYITISNHIGSMKEDHFYSDLRKDYVFYTIEMFENEFPFKVNDSVQIIENNEFGIIEKMEWEKGEVIYLVNIDGFTYRCKKNDFCHDTKHTDIALLESTETEANDLSGYTKAGETLSTGYCQLDKTVKIYFNKENYEKEVELDLGDYEIEVKNGRTFAVLKKPKYPTTYGECCDVIGYDPCEDEINCYKSGIIESFVRLLICRNAYWKIAGEEMGLDKLWEPDWNTSVPKYVIACTSNGIEKQWETTYCKCLAFPTKEILDMFLEHFRDLIEKCKELL